MKYEAWYEDFFLGIVNSYDEAEELARKTFGFWDGHELYIFEVEEEG